MKKTLALQDFFDRLFDMKDELKAYIESKYENLVSDPEHWAEYDIHTIDQLEYYLLLCDYVDLYKEVNGFKPFNYSQLKMLTFEELKKEFDFLAESL